MPDDDPEGHTRPPFDPSAALATLRRQLRELGLTEREGRYERRGLVLARAAVDGDAIAAGLVRQPVRSSPEWQMRRLRSAAEVRDWLAEARRRLAGWGERED
jgi:hypothetical protein